jgi:hypothetical protein
VTEDALTVVPVREPVEWFEEIIPVRGCHMSLDGIKEVYRELSRINREFGKRIIADLERDENITAEQWAARKEFLLTDAFRLTVTITGHRDQRVYAEVADIFSSENLPKQIKKIYFNNITAFRRHANGEIPRNKFEVTLDFDKPALLAPNPLVSAATPNNSIVSINADDISFFRAVQQVIITKLTRQRTWHGFLHKNFAYDLGFWVLALPVALYFATYYMDVFFPSDSKLASFRPAFFIYAVGMMLILYRFLSSYAKWAFPVNVLAENKDKALRHRLALAALAVWLLYKIADTLYAVMIP